MENSPINHISDTAAWIAEFRAQESDRPDAVFKDPLARRLSGERGRQIVAATPHSEAMAFAMIVRTTAIDRLVEAAIAKGVDTIINLGAGLDTRPYRMKLPAGLRWIEVDFPHMIAFKNEQLRNEKPVCVLERIATDLAEDSARRSLFKKLGEETTKALIITEGLIGYLTNTQAAQLSQDIFSIASFSYWIQDYSQGKMRKNRQTKDITKNLANAPLQFDVADPLTFFKSHGWKVCENIFILDEADRIGRKLPMMFPWSILLKIFPNIIRKIGNKTYGYVMFCRQ